MPLPLWFGILGGPIAWSFDLGASYSVVKWVCRTHDYGVWALITIASFAIVAASAAVSWTALARTANDGPADGGQPRQRARFMAVLGLAASALFALQIAAGSIPPWMIDACR